MVLRQQTSSARNCQVVSDNFGCQFLSKLDNSKVYCTMFCHFHDSLLAHQIIFLFCRLRKGEENGTDPLQCGEGRQREKELHGRTGCALFPLSCTHYITQRMNEKLLNENQKLKTFSSFTLISQYFLSSRLKSNIVSNLVRGRSWNRSLSSSALKQLRKQKYVCK